MLVCCYEEALIPVAFGSEGNRLMIFVSAVKKQDAEFPHRWNPLWTHSISLEWEEL